MTENIAIIGNNASKFAAGMEAEARNLIRQLLSRDGTVLVSGHCHEGGIDIWAEEEADLMGIKKIIFKPEIRQWNPPGKYGFKARNLDIARNSDKVNVIVASEYLPEYNGMRFDVCYHCSRAGRPAETHVKSGACWTLNEALKQRKSGQIHIIKLKEE